jgi:ApaG protein
MGNIFSVNTNNIMVSAQPEYMEYESSPIDGQYVWVYHIKIHNNSKSPVQVMNRYWHITDGKGMVQEVRGPGVVGLQPMILPDEHFEYTSSVSLNTPTGIMHGTYEIRNSDETIMEVSIPVFSLDSTEAIRYAN